MYAWKSNNTLLEDILNEYDLKRPYIGRNRKEIRDQILAKQVQIKRNEIPEGWSLEATDFINKVIFSIKTIIIFRNSLFRESL